MTKEQKIFLDGHRTMYNSFKSSGVIAHLSNQDAKQFLEIAQHFNKDYNTSLWCGDCVMNLVEFVFKQYDKFKTEDFGPADVIEIRNDQFPPYLKELSKKPVKHKSNGKGK